jgi:Ca2+-binding EF-hand superfamily protein
MRKLIVMLLVGPLAFAVALRAEEEVAFVTAPAGAATVVSHFESADRNADGQISTEEFRNRMTKVFFELDADGDGLLQESELANVLLAEHHEEADQDTSQTLTLQEFMGYTLLLFETVDANGDGHITREEMAAAGHEEDN